MTVHLMSRAWILGASDPEMEAIDRLLRESGERVSYALGPDGQRVRAGDAYRVAALSEPIPAGSVVYRVECDGPAIPADAIVIDHHRPGDPGYGRPPAEYLPASSIGQVIVELGRLGRLPLGTPDWPAIRSVRYDGVEQYVTDTGATRVSPGRYSRHYVQWAQVANIYRRGPAWWRLVVEQTAYQVPFWSNLCAAADHCLAAAYRGDCPGVDPDALMRWRAETRAAYQRRPVESVLADVERARDALRAAPIDHVVAARDLRGQYIPELPEAAAREGECFLASLTERDGRVKIVCQSGTPEQIEAFMRVWAPEHGLTNIYGDPQRGFAGGYVV